MIMASERTVDSLRGQMTLNLGSLGDAQRFDHRTKSVEQALAQRDVPDALFPTDNEWGIPTLDPALQADFVDLPVQPWGAKSRKVRMPGTYHFYVDDYRFSKLWADPSPVVNSGCLSVVEPNFTTNEQMPRAVALYRIHQKRWLARYWQSYGLRVFVDLNVDPSVYDLALLGVPYGWLAYATRGYSAQIDCLNTEHTLACERAMTERILFLVIGSSEAVRGACHEHGWVYIHIPSETQRKHNTLTK